jgi:hypothetical protein
MTRAALSARVAALITRLSDGSRDDAARDALLRDLLRWQRAHVEVYARIVSGLAGSEIEDPLRWPAVPTDVFRIKRVAAHAPELDVRVFRTSGTSTATRGSHPLRELLLYDLGAHAAARRALFPDRSKMRLVILAPSAAEAPDSSLSYMLDRFAAFFGLGQSVQVLRDGKLDAALLESTLTAAQRASEPLALLGTSFAFVHAEEALGTRRFALPPGSRIMQTGGFKGRSRTFLPDEMLQLLGARYGVPAAYIVQEYGMTELCSQLYETTLRDAVLGRAPGPRRLCAPAWVRVSVVDPDTLLPVTEAAEGLLRIDDPCNVDTACAIQTSDRGRRVDDGVIVLGRATGATPRGCSLAVDAALGG